MRVGVKWEGWAAVQASAISLSQGQATGKGLHRACLFLLGSRQVTCAFHSPGHQGSPDFKGKARKYTGWGPETEGDTLMRAGSRE